MTDAHELQIEINRAIKDLRESYRETVETMLALKNRMNVLELRAIENGDETSIERERLTLAAESLDRFVDSVIHDIVKAWKRHDRMRRQCELLGFEPPSMKALKMVCEENEQLAKDLLCYSLGRLRQVKSI